MPLDCLSGLMVLVKTYLVPLQLWVAEKFHTLVPLKKWTNGTKVNQNSKLTNIKYPLSRENRRRTLYLNALNKRFCSRFGEVSQVWQTAKDQRVQWSNHCEYNNQNEHAGQNKI